MSGPARRVVYILTRREGVWRVHRPSLHSHQGSNGRQPDSLPRGEWVQPRMTFPSKGPTVCAQRGYSLYLLGAASRGIASPLRQLRGYPGASRAVARVP